MKTEKDDRAKQEILLSAQELFRQYGLKKTTMDEIAAACGKAKSTLYHYFKNKEEVFDEVIMKEMMNIRKVVSEKVNSRISLQDKIKTYLVEFYTEAMEKINLLRILQQNRLEEIAKFDRLKTIIDFEQAYIESIVVQSYEKKEYQGIPKEDIPLLAEVLVVSFLGLVRYSIEKDQGVEFDKLAKIADSLVSKIFS